MTSLLPSAAALVQRPFASPCEGRQCSSSGRLAHSQSQLQPRRRHSQASLVFARAATQTRAPTSSWAPSISESVASLDGATAQTKTFSSFDKMLEQNELPVLVDFHATWCGPCQLMNNVVGQLSKRLEGAISCIRLDTDKYPTLATRYDVQALPTLILFRDGKPIDKVEGYVGVQQLQDRMNFFLGRPMGPGRYFKPRKTS